MWRKLGSKWQWQDWNPGQPDSKASAPNFCESPDLDRLVWAEARYSAPTPWSPLPVRASLARSRACPSASSCSRRASSWASCRCTSNRLLSRASFSKLQHTTPRASASGAPGSCGFQGVASPGPGASPPAQPVPRSLGKPRTHWQGLLLSNCLWANARLWRGGPQPEPPSRPPEGWAQPKASPQARGFLRQGSAFTLGRRQLHSQAGPLLGQRLLLPGCPLQCLYLPLCLPPRLLQLTLPPAQLPGELAPTQGL